VSERASERVIVNRTRIRYGTSPVYMNVL